MQFEKYTFLKFYQVYDFKIINYFELLNYYYSFRYARSELRIAQYFYKK